MRFFLTALFFFTVCAAAVAQNELWRNEILDERIGAVTFYPAVLNKDNFEMPLAKQPLAMPIVELNEPTAQLLLNFDLFGDEQRSYVYTIEHCNHDWTRSDLTEDEYMIGFREARIRDVEASFLTRKSYSLYSLVLPNSDMTWTKSGNYILRVFDETDYESVLVLKLRFFVTEPSVWVYKGGIVRPGRVFKEDTHHEIDFVIDTKTENIVAARSELHSYIIKNGRWDTAIGPMKPSNQNGNQQIYDYQDSIIFEAGRESRFFDMRTFEFRKQNVQRILVTDDYYEVALTEDKRKKNNGFLDFPDADGNFVLENQTPNSTFLQSDYAHVLFRLNINEELENCDIYIVGAFNDYALLPKYQMEFSDKEQVYFKEVPLKQGYYNYEYVVVKNGTYIPNKEQTVEGNWYETNNYYKVFSYYRGFGERYDKLMGIGNFRSDTSRN
jgi:hypothetical protein